MADILNMKSLAMVFLFIVGIASLFVAVVDLMSGKAIQPEVSLVLGTSIGYCLTILGLNHGVSVINGTIEKTITGALNAQQYNKPSS